jgi:hypothetical protein
MPCENGGAREASSFCWMFQSLMITVGYGRSPRFLWGFVGIQVLHPRHAMAPAVGIVATFTSLWTYTATMRLVTTTSARYTLGSSQSAPPRSSGGWWSFQPRPQLKYNTWECDCQHFYKKIFGGWNIKSLMIIAGQREKGFCYRLHPQGCLPFTLTHHVHHLAAPDVVLLSG